MVPLPFHKDQSEGFVHACGRVLKKSYYAYILDTAKGHSGPAGLRMEGKNCINMTHVTG